MRKPPFILPPVALQAVLATLSLAACSSAKITVESPDTAVGTPQLTIDPTVVDFGTVSAGMGGTASVLGLANTGDADLHILGFGLDSPDGPFEVSSVGSNTLAPGESTGAILTFDPDTAGSYAQTLTISSNDPDGLTEAVLLGEAEDGGLALDPSSWDFGTLSVGCAAAVDVAVQNVGGSAVTVNSITVTGAEGEISLNNAAPLPWTLQAGASQTVTVGYSPQLVHVVFGTLTVSTNSTATPTVTGTYFGAAQADPTATDHFTTPDGIVDVVVFVDKSSSMQDTGYVNRFRASMVTLYDTLLALDADFQIAVVTDDDGCVNGRANTVTGATPRNQALSTLSIMFDTTYYGGELAEEGFTVLSQATSLEATSERGCNAGIVRPTGALALLGVSDEDEQSGGDEGAWVSTFTGLKSDPTRVHLSAISGDLPAGCDDAKPGTVWSDVAQLTGGSLYSICGSSVDWTKNLASIASLGTGLLSAYPLSSDPDVRTLTVSIDGQPTSNWTYDATSRSVVFTAAAGLTWNQSIDIHYEIAQSCGE